MASSTFEGSATGAAHRQNVSNSSTTRQKQVVKRKWRVFLTKDKRKGFCAGYKKLGPTSRILFWIAIASIAFSVLAHPLGWLFYARSQRAARHLANITRSRPVPFVRKFPVIIEDGSNTQEMRIPGRYSPAISRCPFSFFITEDGSINLRGAIYDAEGNIVVEGTGDSIRAIQSTKCDINSDAKAIEVVDINLRPVFQLMVVPYEDFITEKAQRHVEEFKRKKIEEVIRLSYITKQGETWSISSPDESISVKSLEENECSLIPRLFCYPGYSHPGKRVQ